MDETDNAIDLTNILMHICQKVTKMQDWKE